MIPLSQFPKEALDWAFGQAKDRGDWNSQTIRDLADQYLKTNLMKTDPRAPIMGSIRFGPKYIPEEDGYAFKSVQEAIQAFRDANDPWSAPLSFRDFLRLKKSVLEAYEEYQSGHQASMDTGGPGPEWPEALQGLTREDIEILKL